MKVHQNRFLKRNKTKTKRYEIFSLLHFHWEKYDLQTIKFQRDSAICWRGKKNPLTIKKLKKIYDVKIE